MKQLILERLRKIVSIVLFLVGILALVVTLSTTKAHVHSILQKLYLTDRTKAAVTAIKEGLVQR